MALRIRGGITGAGTRVIRERPKTGWKCPAGHANPAYATRCLMLGCNVARDQAAA